MFLRIRLNFVLTCAKNAYFFQPYFSEYLPPRAQKTFYDLSSEKSTDFVAAKYSTGRVEK